MHDPSTADTLKSNIMHEKIKNCDFASCIVGEKHTLKCSLSPQNARHAFWPCTGHLTKTVCSYLTCGNLGQIIFEKKKRIQTII